VLRRSVKRPNLTSSDRLLWAWLCKVWIDWQSSLVIVKPENVIGWHRKGFQLFWTWKARHGQPARPAVSKEMRQLIRKMSRENPLWERPASRENCSNSASIAQQVCAGRLLPQMRFAVGTVEFLRKIDARRDFDCLKSGCML
jgi:hypothetical protein